MRYVVFDVETPNSANDRMSALGICVVEDGFITEEFFSLVNPEARFDNFNINLTGITPQMVENKPNFANLWLQIEKYFNSGVIVAHNAAFDLSVLSKCLHSYGICWLDDVAYACTCVMGRACYPNLKNHQLSTLSKHLGIVLDHHQADSDSLAAAKLLINYMDNGLDVTQYVKTYSISNCRVKQKVIGGRFIV